MRRLSDIVQAVTPEAFGAVLGNTQLASKQGITAAQGFGVEFLLGFVLVLVVFAVCDPNRPECKYAAPLAIGLTVALGHLATVSIHKRRGYSTTTRGSDAAVGASATWNVTLACALGCLSNVLQAL